MRGHVPDHTQCYQPAPDNTRAHAGILITTRGRGIFTFMIGKIPQILVINQLPPARLTTLRLGAQIRTHIYIARAGPPLHPIFMQNESRRVVRTPLSPIVDWKNESQRYHTLPLWVDPIRELFIGRGCFSTSILHETSPTWPYDPVPWGDLPTYVRHPLPQWGALLEYF